MLQGRTLGLHQMQKVTPNFTVYYAGTYELEFHFGAYDILLMISELMNYGEFN